MSAITTPPVTGATAQTSPTIPAPAAAVPAAAVSAPAPAAALPVAPAPIVAAPATPAAVAPAAPEASTPPTPAPTPNLVQQVAAAARSKGALVAERDAARTRATTAEASLEAMTAERDAALAENVSLREERAGIQAALTTAQTEASTVADEVTTVVAAQGFEPNALPLQQEVQGTTLEQALAKLEACTDPKEKAVLAREVRDIRSKSK